jgi:hypothetical protein
MYKFDPLAARIATAAGYNLEEPTFFNILELIEDNVGVFNISPTIYLPRLAAQARQIILTPKED